MMTHQFVNLRSIALALGLLLPLGCDEDDGGDDATAGEDGNDDGDTGEDGNDDGDTGNDGNDDATSGPSTTSTTSTSSTTSTTTTTTSADEGSGSTPACESFFDCPTIICPCPDGDVETASCVEGMCADESTCLGAPHNTCE